jgi:leucyl aminopeptidase
MKFSKAALLATALPAVSGRFVEEHEINNVLVYPDGSEQETYLIELAPGETRRVTEDEKWELRRVSIYSSFEPKR